MSAAPDATALRRFSAACACQGLDICHPFSAASVNQRLAAERAANDAALDFELPTFGRPAQAYLVGNTRALWPMVRRCISDAPLSHPLNRYVENTLTALATELGCRFWLGWSHRAEPTLLPIQRIARAAGFADLAPSHLSVHPTFGPWFALRAVLVLDHDADSTSHAAPALCGTCTQPCVAAFEAARAGQTPTAQAVREASARWVAVRDACPFGKDFRYGAEQIAYHYAGVIPSDAQPPSDV